MPNGKEEDCPHENTNIVWDEGYFEERCMECGWLLDRWKGDKDIGPPGKRGPA